MIHSSNQWWPVVEIMFFATVVCHKRTNVLFAVLLIPTIILNKHLFLSETGLVGSRLNALLANKTSKEKNLTFMPKVIAW